MSKRCAVILFVLSLAGCGVVPSARGPSRAQIEAMQTAQMDRVLELMKGQQDAMEGKDTDAARAYARQMEVSRAQGEALQRQMEQDPEYRRQVQEERAQERQRRRNNPSGIDTQFNLTDQQEVEVGFGMVQYFLSSQRLLDDQPLQTYVNRVGSWVALQSERPHLPWRFVVLDSAAVNAFAVPGGYVFVTTGMLRMLRTESELAGVLGHEISHVVRKHHLRWIYMNKELSAQMQRTEAAMQNLDPAMAQQLREIGKLAQRQIESMNSGPMKANLSKGEELEADRDGIVLAWRAGYEAWGLVAMLQRFEAASRLSQAAQTGLEGHPEPLERFKYLDWLVQQRPDAQNAGEVGTARFEQATRRLRGTNL